MNIHLVFCEDAFRMNNNRGFPIDVYKCVFLFNGRKRPFVYKTNDKNLYDFCVKNNGKYIYLTEGDHDGPKYFAPGTPHHEYMLERYPELFV